MPRRLEGTDSITPTCSGARSRLRDLVTALSPALEEREEQEVEEKPPGSQEKANCPDDKVNIADKFRAKLENVKENVRMPDGMRIRKKEKGEGGGEGKEEKKERSSEKKEKRREKQKSESRSNNYIKEDAEQEDGIRLSSLPNDPPGPLHSPESGNTSLHQV